MPFIRVTDKGGEKMTVEEAVGKYSNMLYKICIVMLCSEQDAQDAVQDTFCRYMEKRPEFADKEHEKAWMIHVASNISRDMLRFRTRHQKISIDQIANDYITPGQTELLSELLELPIKYRTVLYLHYVEGYQIREIAAILKITEPAVKKRMQRGREQLRLAWKEAHKK